MAYFSNGSEGIDWELRWCSQCVNYRPVKELDDGTCNCPILEVHFLWNGDDDKRELLDHLIPMKPGGAFADKCSMFLEGDFKTVEERTNMTRRLREWNEAMGDGKPVQEKRTD